MQTLKKVWKYARWPLFALLLVYIGAVLMEVNWPVSRAKSDAAVAAIQAQRLTMKDVDGSNLPPVPDPAKVNATVKGIDANANGVRDDVELAIYNRYPDDIKVRVASLQYAQALQTMMTLIVNEETWLASVYRESQAKSCIFSLAPNAVSERSAIEDFVYLSVVNNAQREQAVGDTKGFATSFTVPQDRKCDISFD